MFIITYPNHINYQILHKPAYEAGLDPKIIAKIHEAKLNFFMFEVLNLHGALLHAHQVILRVESMLSSHTFCYECVNSCIKTKPNCPVCRTAVVVKDAGRDLLAYNIINELEVFCIYEDCSWRVK